MGKRGFQEICKGKTIERNPPMDKGFLDGRGDDDYVPDLDGSVKTLSWGGLSLGRSHGLREGRGFFEKQGRNKIWTQEMSKP